MSAELLSGKREVAPCSPSSSMTGDMGDGELTGEEEGDEECFFSALRLVKKCETSNLRSMISPAR